MICENGILNRRILDSCQCSMTSMGHEEETKRFVFRIHKKSRCTRRHSRRVETKRSGMEDAITNLKENGILFHKCQCLDSWNLEEVERKRNHTLQCGYSEHRALIPNHSFCQSAQYLRNSFKMVWRVRSEDQNSQTKNSVNREILQSVNSQEVKSLVCAPRTKAAPGTDCEKIFSTLNHYPEQFTRICELASFVHRIDLGMKHKTIPDVDDGFGDFVLAWREYILLRLDLNSRVFAAIPGGTVIGPVLEVHIVLVHGKHGLEIKISSSNDPNRTSWVVICRGKNQFVNELPVPNPGPNLTSSEVLEERQEIEFCSVEQEPSSTGRDLCGTIQDSSWSDVLYFGIVSYNLRIHWWTIDSAWIDGSHRHFTQLERVCTPQRLFFQPQLYPGNRYHCRRKRMQGGKTHYFLHTS